MTSYDSKRSGLIEKPRDSSRGSIKRGSVDTPDKRRRGDEIEVSRGGRQREFKLDNLLLH